MDNGPQIPRDLGVKDASVPWCPLNVDVPWPIDQRLAELVDLVHDDHLGPTSKRELAAALIQTAPLSGLELWDRVLSYRRSTVGDVAFWIPPDVEVIQFSARKQGRRPI